MYSRLRTWSGWRARNWCRRNERATFGYDARSIDWWDYWINVHIPALRKWCYPLIEGRPLEERPRRNIPRGAGLQMAPREAAGSRSGERARIRSDTLNARSNA